MWTLVVCTLVASASALPPRPPTAPGELQPDSGETGTYSLQDVTYIYGDISWDEQYKDTLQAPELDIRPLLAFLDLVMDKALYDAVVMLTGMSITEESAKIYKYLGVVSMLERLAGGDSELLRLAEEMRAAVAELAAGAGGAGGARGALRAALARLLAEARARGAASEDDERLVRLLFESVPEDYLLVDPERVRRLQHKSWF